MPALLIPVPPLTPSKYILSQWPLLNINLPPREAAEHHEKGTHLGIRETKAWNWVSTHQLGGPDQVTQLWWASVSETLQWDGHEDMGWHESDMRNYKLTYGKGPAQSTFYLFYYYPCIIGYHWSYVSMNSPLPHFPVGPLSSLSPLFSIFLSHCLLWTEFCPSPTIFIFVAIIPQKTIIEIGPLGRVIKIKGGDMVGPWSNKD